MSSYRVMIVDDEKNIRLTMSQALESMDCQLETAINGEEALQKLAVSSYHVVFLDLKMPGMGGIEVLTRIKERWPGVKTVIITAHGTIDAAVEAMKIGAADFIQKPFSPSEIREAFARVLDSNNMESQNSLSYSELIQQTRRYIADRSFDKAILVARKAISIDPSQAPAYNILGAILEIKGDWIEAQKFYRAARDIDPTYRPASENLKRTSSWSKEGVIDLGGTPEKSEW